MIEPRYINRDLSWLSFNERVLQEASDPLTPLIERVKFLGIFSSNMDEFFRVRVATVKRMERAGKKAREFIGISPKKLLESIETTVLKLQNRFDETYCDIRDELESNNIFIIDESRLTKAQGEFVRIWFHDKVRPVLFPVMIDDLEQFPELKDHAIYLGVCLRKQKDSKRIRHAIIEVPSNILPRFLVLPKEGDKTFIILLDDVIRFGLDLIFSLFGYTQYEAYTIKVTRDAELDLDDDITKSFFENMSRSLKQRKWGDPVRFIYDSAMPVGLLKLFTRRLNLTSTDTLIPGGRYHNFKDFMKFPFVGTPELRYEQMPPLPHPDLDIRTSMLSVIKKRDVLLHYPYQSFTHIIDLLREASLDPRVVTIKMTLYRVAELSGIINALIRAVRNGKKVTVVIELQARFDEEANIYWTSTLREEGVHIIHGVPNLKVHSKLCLISRIERGSRFNYAAVGTGNFNENTARVYSDHCLLTADTRITDEVYNTFEFFESNYKVFSYENLVVSPFYMRLRMGALIDSEIANANKGREAMITIKTNSLHDQGLIDRLYQASRAGVRVRCIVRGICSLVPGITGLSENITVVSIVDRFLEHSRIFVFHNNGDEKYFISSADWMTRNVDRRVEVGCPIYDKRIKRELREFLDIQLKDNTKARILDARQENKYKRKPDAKPVRAQIDFYRHIQSRLDELDI
jgi:polyphosphate kinase